MHYGCLEVTQRTGKKDTILSDSCTLSPSASIVYAITPENGTTFIGVGYMKFDNEFMTDILEKAFAGNRRFIRKENQKTACL